MDLISKIMFFVGLPEFIIGYICCKILDYNNTEAFVINTVLILFIVFYIEIMLKYLFKQHNVTWGENYD